MKIDNIEPAFPFDPMDDSITTYENKMLMIIEKRIDILKNLNSNEWNDFSDSAYELFNAYSYLIKALESIGKVSPCIRYAQAAIEYCEIYRKYVDVKKMNEFSSLYEYILNKYKR